MTKRKAFRAILNASTGNELIAIARAMKVGELEGDVLEFLARSALALGSWREVKQALRSNGKRAPK